MIGDYLENMSLMSDQLGCCNVMLYFSIVFFMALVF